MRLFELHRDVDVTGVSGTGVVASGVEFDDGTTVIRWKGETPSTVVWTDLADAEAIHGHVGSTRFVWLDYAGDPLGNEPEPESRTPRGFGTWLSTVDTYSKSLSVQSSSAAEIDAVWIYTDGGAAHLDASGAVQVRNALNGWLHSIADPATWSAEPTPTPTTESENDE
jgi:hypothetical protein